ncbi:MAG: phosphate ABC transporter substrate-binding protein PstS, partial [Acidimicrobiales bacterium]
RGSDLVSRLARVAVAFVALATMFIGIVAFGGPIGATAYVPISGEGSSWSAGAIDQWIADEQSAGMRVNFTANGSTQGRLDWINGLTDFAASDIPFQTDPQDGSAPEHPRPGSYAYMPITAGGTVFMYNLRINGQQVTNLRLSGENIAKIFTGQITNWDDPAIAADNPALKLPNQTIVPVVRSDGAGSSYQLSAWMISQYPSIWNAYCQSSGRAPACGATSFWPTVAGSSMIAQNGDLGVSSYVSQSYAAGSIGYVNYYYALTTNFPVALMLNSAGYYTEPTPQNVAVSLLSAQVDTTDVNNPALYLTQKLQGVYTDPDPRTYPLSAYSYLILPTTVSGQFNTAKGATLAAFSYYAMCAGQQQVSVLGYSPLPINLVEAGFAQIAKIPGAVVQNINIAGCDNPTFDPATGANLLAVTAPYPPACDKQGPTQCVNGTGGAAASTDVTGNASAGVTNTGATSATGITTSGAGTAATSGTAAVGPGASTCSASATSARPSGSSTSSTTASTDCSRSKAAPPLGAPSPITDTLAVNTGWGSVQSALALAVAGLLLLIALPALFVRWLGRRRARRSLP